MRTMRYNIFYKKANMRCIQPTSGDFNYYKVDMKDTWRVAKTSEATLVIPIWTPYATPITTTKYT